MLYRNEPPAKRKKRAVVLAESPSYAQGGRDNTFITEGENVRKFYQNNPDVDVQIMPFYGDEEFESIKSQMGMLSPEDEVYVFGHKGKTLGGVPHEQIAGTLKEKGVKNCFMGSCSFEDYANPYKDIQNFSYRPDDSWWGFNPNAKSPIEGMFSRVTDRDEEGFAVGQAARIVNPQKGKHYNKVLNRQMETPITVPRRSFKELF